MNSNHCDQTVQHSLTRCPDFKIYIYKCLLRISILPKDLGDQVPWDPRYHSASSSLLQLMWLLVCVHQPRMSAQLTLFWRVRRGLVLNMHQGHMDLSPWQPSQKPCGADREAVRLTQTTALHIIICCFQAPAASVTDGVGHWGLDLWPTPSTVPHLSLQIFIYAVSLVKLH